jgi:Domain of unknown function (DUF4124)
VNNQCNTHAVLLDKKRRLYVCDGPGALAYRRETIEDAGWRFWWGAELHDLETATFQSALHPTPLRFQSERPHPMKDYFVCVGLFCLCSIASAQGIYKWTDENGKVHYSDKNDAPQKNTQTVKLAPGGQASSAPAGAGASSAGGTPGSNTSPGTLNAATLDNCLAMARSMADKNRQTPTDSRADIKRLLDMCPNTAYECVTYSERPEGNSCRAVPLQPGGSLLKNTGYKR